MQQKKQHPVIKTELHERNKHRARYDFDALMACCPELKPYVITNKFGDVSIDFFNADSVKTLNKALLQYYYGIEHWDIPKGYLCPPIPGRADYIHNIADVLASCNNTIIPTGSNIKVLDVGVGANCVYPIIGHSEYGWSFIGSDIDSVALKSASNIIENNLLLKNNSEVRLQKTPTSIFNTIIKPNERIDATICNPPFHSSLAEAQSGSIRKVTNLKKTTTKHVVLNFGGQHSELWCKGGEVQFLKTMIAESQKFSKSVFWFSSLISKQTTLKSVYYELEQTQATEIKTILMGQGNKISRLVAWTFLSKSEQQTWVAAKWSS